MRNRRSTVRQLCALAGAGALALGTLTIEARHAGPQGAAHHTRAAAGKPPSSDFIQTVKAATERFKDVAVAEAEGYSLMFGCVSGPDWGAMGLHYVNLALVGDGQLDPARPEIVIYEPLPNGKVRLIGADFLVFAADWHKANQATPELGGQLLHLIESPNRYGLPTFYTLHVWAWKDNPAGTFSNWHSNVSCDAFSGKDR